MSEITVEDFCIVASGVLEDNRPATIGVLTYDKVIRNGDNTTLENIKTCYFPECVFDLYGDSSVLVVTAMFPNERRRQLEEILGIYKKEMNNSLPEDENIGLVLLPLALDGITYLIQNLVYVEASEKNSKYLQLTMVFNNNFTIIQESEININQIIKDVDAQYSNMAYEIEEEVYQMMQAKEKQTMDDYYRDKGEFKG